MRHERAGKNGAPAQRMGGGKKARARCAAMVSRIVMRISFGHVLVVNDIATHSVDRYLEAIARHFQNMFAAYVCTV